MISFASDNNSGVHPRIMRAIEAANTGHCIAYGSDSFTLEAEKTFKSIFGPDTRAFFVFLGTAANVLSIKACTKSYEAVICASTAHINTDECGAVEAVGRKLYTVPGKDGKLRPDDFKHLLVLAHEVHHAWPKMVSITQSTELGTLYNLEEIRALADFCHNNGLYLHMDGARIANAVAALGCGLKEATVGSGVDIMSFGGTKNGLMYGEAVLFFNPELARDFAFYRKQNMQLGSKMRYISAQFDAYLKDALWLKNAAHANKMAALLAASLQDVPGLEIAQPVQVNAVFARLPRKAVEPLQKSHYFYLMDETPYERPLARWMTSFDTTEENVLDFARAVRAILA